MQTHSDLCDGVEVPESKYHKQKVNFLPHISFKNMRKIKIGSCTFHDAVLWPLRFRATWI